MIIGVYIRTVIDIENNLRCRDNKIINPDKMEYSANIYDLYALEEAVRIKESQDDVTVIAISIGNQHTCRILENALAIGADKSIHIYQDTESILTNRKASQVLKKLIHAEEIAMLITGSQAPDILDYSLVGYLSQCAGIKAVNSVIKLIMQENQLEISKQLDDGTQNIIKENLPIILGVTKGINEPRLPGLRGIMMAKKKTHVSMNIEDIVEGDGRSEVKLTKLTCIEHKKECRFISMDEIGMKHMVEVIEKYATS